MEAKGQRSADVIPGRATLRREAGVFAATLMGLGSIIGTGIFVSIGLAAGVAGPAVILAVLIAAVVATFNALSSAQLAASHPVSGGTYEYGYRYLRPWLGFSAGWMFLCAKTASAATAALGFSGYLLRTIGVLNPDRWLLAGIGAAAVVVLTLVVLGGLRRSSRFNVVVVTLSILSLALFVAVGTTELARANLRSFAGTDADEHFWPALFNATAMMFVAYTGYGRIATLSEEVREPRKTIPRAIMTTLAISAVLYAAVAIVALGTIGARELAAVTAADGAPLEHAARLISGPARSRIVAVGAMAAMLSVLLNLVLGLSRVVLAMGRRGDMPAIFARLNPERTTPSAAVAFIGLAILALVLGTNIKMSWSFSAFTVLVYYAITNLSALALPQQDRLYGRWVALAGLICCLFLCFWVDRAALLSGVAMLLIGLAWHAVRGARRRNAVF